jgi:hypothetical protein
MANAYKILPQGNSMQDRKEGKVYVLGHGGSLYRLPEDAYLQLMGDIGAGGISCDADCPHYHVVAMDGWDGTTCDYPSSGLARRLQMLQVVPDKSGSSVGDRCQRVDDRLIEYILMGELDDFMLHKGKTIKGRQA